MKRLWLVLLALVLVMAVGGCQPESTQLEPSPRAQEIRTAGKLVIGTAVTAPFVFHDEQSGQLVGMDVEIAEAIAKRIGVPIEWKEMAFVDLIPSLQNGDVDMVIAAMYITDQRKEKVDMSQGYVETGLVMVARADELRFQTPEELGGLIVGVKEGSTGARYARKLIDQGIALKLQEYSDTKDSLEDLANGYVDVALNDKVNTIEYIKTHQELKIVGDVLEPAQFGIAVQKGDSGMLEIVNAALKDLRDQKKLDSLYEKWVQGH